MKTTDDDMHEIVPRNIAVMDGSDAGRRFELAEMSAPAAEAFVLLAFRALASADVSFVTIPQHGG